MKRDLPSIKKSGNIYQNALYPNGSYVKYFEDEDNGLDVSGYTIDRGRVLFIPYEVKTFHSHFLTFSRNYSNKRIFRFLGDDYHLVSQETVSALRDEVFYDLPERGRYMEISACNMSKDGNMFLTDNEKYLPKWQKLMKYNGGLHVLFEDGSVWFDNQMLRNAFVGYCYCYEETKNGSHIYQWQLKALIDLDKGIFFEEKMPEEIFTKKKERYFN